MNVCCRRALVDLVPQTAHEDVHRAVAVRLTAAPDPLQELVTRDDAAPLERERVQELELGRRQLGARAAHERLHLARVDAELLDLDRVAARRVLRPHAAAYGRLHASDQLLHRERLDQVVVGADLERVYAVVLGAAGADDEDRRADALAARGLDQPPAVDAGQHQVEDADVGVLVAEPREPDLPRADGDGIEARRAQVVGHSAGDDLVVLDDQDLCHQAYDSAGGGSDSVNGR